MNNLEEKIIQLVAGVMEVNPSIIGKDSSLVEDLGADSLDCIEIFLKVEREFSIKISEKEALECSSIEYLVNFVTSRLPS